MSSGTTGAARNLRLPRFAEEAVERARLTVVPRRRPAPPRVPFAILVGLVLLGGVVGLLMFNTHMQQNSFAVTAQQARASQLHAREQQLRLELDRLRDPQALAVAARRLGMLPPDSPAFLDLDTGRITGTAAPATGLNDFRFTAPDAVKPAALDPDPIVLPREVIEVPADAGARDRRGASSTGAQQNGGTTEPSDTRDRGRRGQQD